MTTAREAEDRSRDAVMWTGYGLISGWAFFIYLIGPSTALIGRDLGLSATAAGFISTMMSFGLVGAGIVGPWSVARWGRPRALLRAAAGLAAGGITIAFAPSYPVVLVGAAIAGMCGAVLANTATAVLAEHRPARTAEVITEGNAFAAWVGLFAPAILGALTALGPSWRAAMLVSAGVALVLLVPISRVLIPRSRQPHPAARQPARRRPPSGELSAKFWFAVVAVAAAAATEFSVNFWGARLIADRTGAPLAGAAAAMTAAVVGVAIGRTFGAGLPRRVGIVPLVVTFFVTALGGVILLITSRSFPLSVLALLVIGLGISVLFPFCQSMALRAAGDQADRALAIVGVALGISIGGAPFLLGWVADQAGLVAGFAIVPVVIGIGITAALGYGRR